MAFIEEHIEQSKTETKMRIPSYHTAEQRHFKIMCIDNDNNKIIIDVIQKPLIGQIKQTLSC